MLCLRRPTHWTAAIALVVMAACSRPGADSSPGAAAEARPAVSSSTAVSGAAPASGGASASASTAGQPPPGVFGGGGCRPTPPPGQPLAWFPPDLPLPPGAYPVEHPDGSGGSASPAGPELRQALFVVPGTLHDWVRFTNAEWHKAGWIQGRGEAEQGEAENTYVRQAASGTEGGAWRVRSVYCDEQLAELLVIYRK